mgnify:CR=1 FL=1
MLMQHYSKITSATVTAVNPPHEIIDGGLLRFLTCGNVDDGKSTLIGRLLYDTKSILTDTLHSLKRTSEKRGLDAVDLSLLTDGLQAEREQGITIDVAYRYFSTGSRKYIIADAPGHEQYTRNMVTAASTANLAIILVDARKGVQTQTLRHATITRLMGIPHIIVAVNKMDLVAYDESVYESIKSDFLETVARLGVAGRAQDVAFVPISALNGDLVVDRGEAMSWYEGPTLLEMLEESPAAHTEVAESFRFPVQYVCRPQVAGDQELHDYRGYMGRVESGEVRVGDEVVVLPSGRRTRVRSIELGGQELEAAIHEQSVTLLLEGDQDVSRGDLIVKAGEEPEVLKEFDAMLCWLEEQSSVPRRKYILRHTTRETRAIVADIEYRLDINTRERESGERLLMNDIAKVRIKVQQALAVDGYDDNRATGAFILIDEVTNNTVAAGMIL